MRGGGEGLFLGRDSQPPLPSPDLHSHTNRVRILESRNGGGGGGARMRIVLLPNHNEKADLFRTGSNVRPNMLVTSNALSPQC